MFILRSLLVISALLVSIAHADTLTGRVVGVADGDTITVLDAAAGLVKAGGRLVAILPSGAKKQEVLDGFLKQWHGPFNNEFAGSSVSVVVLVADAP